MSNLRTLLIIVTQVLLVFTVHAQHEHWKWNSYGVQDGLVNSEGHCLAEDSLGFIWIGTDEGLSRFDGTYFKNFKAIPGDSTSLIDNRVRYLTVEPGGNILIGTISGFSMYDYSTGKFFSHSFDNTGKGEQWNNIIRAFQCWPDGHIWIYTRCNVYDWDRSTNQFTQLDKSLRCTLGGWGPATLPTEDPYKCWVTAPTHLALLDYKTRSMVSIKPKGQVFEPSNLEASLESCTIDKHGKIWYNSTTHGTFYCYDPKTNYQRAFKQDTIEAGKRVPMSTMAIYADRNDRLWVSTWSASAYVLDTLHHKRRHFYVNKQRMEREPVQVIRMYLQTKNGDLWITGNLGLCVHSEAMESVRTTILPEKEGAILPHDQILYCLLADTISGRFFIGAANGLFHYRDDLDKFSFHRYTHEDQAGGINEMIWFNGQLLCGTLKGLYLFDPDQQQFKKWKSGHEELDQAWITGLLLNQGEIFITTRTAKIFRYHISSKTCKVYQNKESDDNSPLIYFYDKLAADHFGNVWLGSHYGLSCFNLKSETFKHFKPTEEDMKKYGCNVWNVLCDADGNIWYAAFHGVFRIDPSKMALETIIKTSTEANQVVFPFFVESDGTTWFSSSEDFYICEKGSSRLQPFTLTQPTNNIFRYYEGVVLPNHVKLFISNYEILWYDHQKHQKSITISSPLINWISSGDSTLTNNSNVIYLHSDQNYFSFTYSSISGAAHSNLEYQYQVVGVDQDWITANKGSIASYNNLSGGEYWINVRVRASGGNWVNMEKPLHLIIALKFYETTLYKASIIIAILLALAIIYYWRKRTEYRITQESAVAGYIDRSGELSFDELSKLLVSTCTTDLNYNAAVIYLSNDEGLFSIQSKMLDKKATWQLPTSQQIAIQSSHDDKLNQLREALHKASLTTWEVIPIVQDEQLLAILALTGHHSAMSISGDRKTAEKLAALYANAISNHLAEMEVKRKEEMLAHINSLLSESQLVSLRAQMNPHFVFNCLNSIQQCIVMRNYSEAGIYLNKFSRLFRMVLNNSSRSLISLEEEISVLTLYIELEHMRFQERFNYTIDFSHDMDVEEIMIPSMLLQPFVENALWHGLMHKEGDRELHIRFYMRDEEVFICEIEDNGIGRERAREIKLQKTETKSNESKGIKISVDRLNLIGIQQGKQADVTFIDKHDEQGQATGTLVRFVISAYLS
ncbi:MAG: histidine kinase [Flavobacteriales bacterium]|nr:histidine kinase [Flavobacteriales bacterium]